MLNKSYGVAANIAKFTYDDSGDVKTRLVMSELGSVVDCVSVNVPCACVCVCVASYTAHAAVAVGPVVNH